MSTLSGYVYILHGYDKNGLTCFQGRHLGPTLSSAPQKSELFLHNLKVPIAGTGYTKPTRQ